MTNLEIIAKEMERAKIEIPCHTYIGWRERGYQVKRGEKAVITTMLWKPVKAKQIKEDEEKQDKMILVKAFLFSEAQVKERKEDGTCEE